MQQNAPSLILSEPMAKIKTAAFLHGKFNLVLIICLLIHSSCTTDPVENKDKPTAYPLFTNSIVSTDIDFIKENDPDAFTAVSFVGTEEKEMPDKRNDQLFDVGTFVYEATFSNGKKVGIWAHSSFGNESAAKIYVDRLTSRLGKLPEFMRDALSHVVIHKGDEGAFAESDGKFFVLYSDNMDTRISNNDLEETVFHEAVHASLDNVHAGSTNWKKAQDADGVFLTDYAAELPTKEDLAETAIFAYTMFKDPERLTLDTREWINNNIPNRIAYLRSIFQ